WRGSPHDQGGGAAQAEHAAERLGRGTGVDLGPAAHGAGQADETDARRAGLDRDEVPGKGPQPPLRDGQRRRRRRAALLERRKGGERGGGSAAATGGTEFDARAAILGRGLPPRSGGPAWAGVTIDGGGAAGFGERPWLLREVRGEERRATAREVGDGESLPAG